MRGSSRRQARRSCVQQQAAAERGAELPSSTCGAVRTFSVVVQTNVCRQSLHTMVCDAWLFFSWDPAAGLLDCAAAEQAAPSELAERRVHRPGPAAGQVHTPSPLLQVAALPVLPLALSVHVAAPPASATRQEAGLRAVREPGLGSAPAPFAWHAAWRPWRRSRHPFRVPLGARTRVAVVLRASAWLPVSGARAGPALEQQQQARTGAVSALND